MVWYKTAFHAKFFNQSTSCLRSTFLKTYNFLIITESNFEKTQLIHHPHNIAQAVLFQMSPVLLLSA